ncbi:MAG: DUF5069 domain-containing protein [Candidatus Coatesbacteria bacterium]
MDLTKSYPRRPIDQLGGYVWLPRLIDKARAKLANSLGEYIYNCGSDQHFFSFTGLAADAFLEAVRTSPDDAGVLAWVKAHAQPHSDAEIAAFNTSFAARGPDTPGAKTWFQAIDADEKRL